MLSNNPALLELLDFTLTVCCEENHFASDFRKRKRCIFLEQCKYFVVGLVEINCPHETILFRNMETF